MIYSAVPVILAPPASPHVRSQGIHVSRLIKGIAVEMGILRSEWGADLSLAEVSHSKDAWWSALDPVSKLRISLGLAWEEWYAQQLPDVLDHPGEMCREGIFMTHDGESVSRVFDCAAQQHGFHTVVHEHKCTFKSYNTVVDLPSQFMWLAQMKAYCGSLDTRFAALHVLFVCGDYSYPISPMLMRWDIEFTQAEIDDNWALLTDYRDARLALEGQ